MWELIAYPVAIILGFLASLGVGGGSLLMLWLTMVIGMDYDIAKTINLLFFLPAAIIATLFRTKQKTIQLKKIYPAILCGCILALIASFVSRQIEMELIKKIFGSLLVLTGIRELFYRPAKER